MIDLGEFSVPIPELARPLSFAAVDAPGIAETKAGACGETVTGPNGTGGDTTAPPGNGTASSGGPPPGGPPPGGGPTTPPQPVEPVTLTMNGAPVKITKAAYSKPLLGDHTIAIETTIGTVYITANKTGTTCSSHNAVRYMTGFVTQFVSASDPCGMTVTSLPEKKGDLMAGTFDGILARTDDPSMTNTVSVKFAVPRP